VEVASHAAQAWEREVDAAKRALHAAREELLCTEDGWEELPEGWTARPLGEVAEIRSGITKGRKVRGELVERPFIRAANVQDGFLDLSEIKTLDITADELARFALAEGDLLLVEGSGSPSRLGTGWLWEGQLDGPVVCQNHVFRVRLDRELLLPRFVAHAVHSGPARAHFVESAKTTSGLATINKTQVSALRIPVPPLPVQRDIVRQLDGLRDARTRALAAAEQAARIRAALAEELLTGVRSAPRLAA
jgi:type I restriction enzyme S subunit